MDANSINRTAMVSGAYQQQLSAQQPVSQSTTNSENKTAGNNKQAANSNDAVQVSSSVTRKNLDTVRAIEMMHASLNQQAKGVRETNESVNNAAEHVSRLRNNLEGIIKNFPPFSVDSKERGDILMGYASLRKELLSLMVPPPPVPVYEKVKHLWEDLFDENGKIPASSIPLLENGSTEAQVNDASQKLANTSRQLTDLSNTVTQALIQP